MKKTMKTLLIALIVLLALSMVLASCGNNDGGAETSGEKDSASTSGDSPSNESTPGTPDETTPGTSEDTKGPEGEIHTHTFGEWTSTQKITLRSSATRPC